MIHARASIFHFIKTQFDAEATGIFTPDLTCDMRVTSEPPIINSLNVRFFADKALGRTYPTWRKLNCLLDLYAEIKDEAPIQVEVKVYEVIQIVSHFMIVQALDKKDFSVSPNVSLGSKITWDWPVNWTNVPLKSERYINKRCLLNFRYFEEKINS